MKANVLLVAAWGYPPSWKKCAYGVRITHENFKGFLRSMGISEDMLSEFKFTTHCSTIATLALLK